LVHTVWPAAEYVPVPHVVHVSIGTLSYVPAAQITQSVRPGVLTYPAEQIWHPVCAICW